MRWMHCTLNLLKALECPVTEPCHVPPTTEGLGNWYANLLRFERKKHLLFTNEETLYTFLVPGILKKDLRNIKNLFLDHLSDNLQHEGFRSELINQLVQEYQEIGFTKTQNRKVLGFMIDFAKQYEFRILQAQGAEGQQLMEMNAEINRTPMSATKNAFYPIERLREVISSLH
ncbi:MAG: hypothetical protein HY200_04725 [Nitrospirae bacterium]|nr:hypothetical protein [Nitrospirota bacterium]